MARFSNKYSRGATPRHPRKYELVKIYERYNKEKTGKAYADLSFSRYIDSILTSKNKPKWVKYYDPSNVLKEDLIVVGKTPVYVYDKSSGKMVPQTQKIEYDRDILRPAMDLWVDKRETSVIQEELNYKELANQLEQEVIEDVRSGKVPAQLAYPVIIGEIGVIQFMEDNPQYSWWGEKYIKFKDYSNYASGDKKIVVSEPQPVSESSDGQINLTMYYSEKNEKSTTLDSARLGMMHVKEHISYEKQIYKPLYDIRPGVDVEYSALKRAKSAYISKLKTNKISELMLDSQNLTARQKSRIRAQLDNPNNQRFKIVATSVYRTFLQEASKVSLSLGVIGVKLRDLSASDKTFTIEIGGVSRSKTKPLGILVHLSDPVTRNLNNKWRGWINRTIDLVRSSRIYSAQVSTKSDGSQHVKGLEFRPGAVSLVKQDDIIAYGIRILKFKVNDNLYNSYGSQTFKEV